MPTSTTLLAFALVALGMVLTPGPNMIYLISRSICQGRAAGLISLGGVALGFVVYMLCAALGITALVFAVPYAYDALRLTGAHAQEAPARSSQSSGANGAQPASRLDHTQPFLFHGRLKGDGERRGTQADNRRANAGAIVVQPNAGQPARE